MISRNRLHRCLCALFVVVAGGAHIIHMLPADRQPAHHVAQRLLLVTLMIAAWAVGHERTPLGRRRTLFAGIAARVLVAPISVSASHDIQRYLWDGAVLLAGLDPYACSPSASSVAELRAIWPTPQEHAAYTTIYPPGGVLLFGIAAGFGPAAAPWIWKLLMVAASIGTLWFGAKALDQRGLSRHLPLIAFSPLLVEETAFGAHLDLVCAFAVSLGLYLVGRGLWRGAGLAFGAGALVKILPGLALLPLAFHRGGQSSRRLLAGAIGIFGAGYLTAFLVGLVPVGDLPVFFEKWRFGSPAFGVLETLIGGRRALRLAPFLVAVAALGIALRARLRQDAGLIASAMAIPLLVSPAVFPWYLAPLIPAMALAPSGFMLAWSTAALCGYEAIDRFQAFGLWQPADWPVWAIGCAWAAGIAADAALRRRPCPSRSIGSEPRLRRISIVIPVLNEEATISDQLDSLDRIEGIHEVIVVDGGSSDRTTEIIGKRRSARLIASPRGRGAQMNAGAGLASGDVLLFLHADVRLPSDAARWVSAALEDRRVVGGAFRTWTLPDGRRSWLAPFLHLADIRSRCTRLPYGDQAIFVRREVFRDVGGFAIYPLMEDLDFSRRLREVGRIRTVPARVRVSGRRFLARPIFYMLLMRVFPLLQKLGVPPSRLAAWYGNPR